MAPTGTKEPLPQDVLTRTKDRSIGGQAVIEGVMIRSPERIATAVRRPDGTLVIRADPYVSLTRRVHGLNLPILRGIVAFGEMLVIGLETLTYSAGIAAASSATSEGGSAGDSSAPERPPDAASSGLGWKETVGGWASLGIALVASVGIFFFLPLAVSSLLGLDRHACAFNLLAGGVRVALLLGYLWAIGRIPDIRRVFAFHGAEHQTIYAYEAEEELTVENAQRYTRFHPRCGTSFILIVVLLAILTYALVDSAFIWVVGKPQSLAERFAVHMLFLPFVAGLSFEALKLSGRYRASRFVRMLLAPGLWLQHLTTRPPDAEHLAVAVAAARASLGLSVSDAQGASVAPVVRSEVLRDVHISR